MPDLAVVVGTDRVIALADVHRDVNVVGKSLEGMVDDIHGRAHLVVDAGVKYGSSIWICLQPAAARRLKFWCSSLPKSVIIRDVSL